MSPRRAGGGAALAPELAGRLFPSGVVLALVPLEPPPPALAPGLVPGTRSPAGEPASAGLTGGLPAVSPRRALELAAGQEAADVALRALGCPEPIVGRDGRRPVWPAGYVGSLTHCDRLCGVVAARQADALALGFDIERRGRVGQRLFGRVCTLEEQAALRHAGQDPSEVATAIFSAKEAVYKALHPLTGTHLTFADVEVSLAADVEGSFTAAIRGAPGGRRLVSGAIVFGGDHVLAGVALGLPPSTDSGHQARA